MGRFGIVSAKAFAVSVGDVRAIAKAEGHDHDLALALWKTGWLEARMLAVFVEKPADVRVMQMNSWARDFDNWAICDTACFHLFDKTPLAWGRVDAWYTSNREFVKRAAFALIASIALHDKRASDDRFLAALEMIAGNAGDERNFVKKGVSWALSGIGNRNARLHVKAMKVASMLASSQDRIERWVGKDAIRNLTSKAARARLARKAAAA